MWKQTESEWAIEASHGYCESPIEEYFAKAWVELCDRESSLITVGGSPEEFVSGIPERTPKTLLHVHQADWIMQQVKIENYRVDFVLGRVAYDYQIEGGEHLVRLPMIIVECDGHDYHEKTKEQAQKDKSRDRRLNQLSYRVLRFTGSELWNNARKCADEVAAMFRFLQNPWLAQVYKETGADEEIHP